MNHRHSTGFWADPKLATNASAFVRCIDEGASTVVLLANAAMSGFDRAAPTLSKGMLENAERALHERGHEVAIALDVAARFLDTVPPDGDDGGPSGWFFAAVVQDGRVSAQWASGDEMLLVRDGRVVERTKGHTAANAGLPATMKHLTRGFGPDFRNTVPENLVSPWTLKLGDRLVCVSRSIVDSIPSDDVARVVSEQGQQAAEKLAQMTAETGTFPFAVAVVLEG